MCWCWLLMEAGKELRVVVGRGQEFVMVVGKGKESWDRLRFLS